MRRHNWYGRSGRGYVFEVFELGAVLAETAGVYILARLDGEDGYFDPLYVGECECLNARAGCGIDSHDRIDAARHAGASHVHALAVDGGAMTRRAIGLDLRNRLHPPCNRG
jgi:hypothetical protein